MKDPRYLSITSFTYNLPEERIAAYPKKDRDSSKLLVWKSGSISSDTFKNLAEYLPHSSLIVFNDTRVVEARLLFKKPTGASIEIFCLEPDDRYPDIITAFSQTGHVYWKCLVGNASAWNAGMILEKTTTEHHTIKAEMIEKVSGHFIIKLSWIPENVSFAEILHQSGLIPLPPYIKRKPEQEDAERYQTVYAHFSGSVAAPTAGLHFTNNILTTLTNKNINKYFVTLHVGAGTFKPVKSSIMQEHEMHAESIEVSRRLISQLANLNGKPVIAVGTTSLRTLESLYWIGMLLLNNEDLSPPDLHVNQWQPYNERTEVTVKDSLNAILKWMDKRKAETLSAKTSLLIAPGYDFRIVNVLITNFHQPGSTLLLLVAAFIGENWKSVYTYALENDFRFLSYGDSCLLFRQ
jgi:S-adenosylmethionine:tRNA ribosyltransferase-isomerase